MSRNGVKPQKSPVEFAVFVRDLEKRKEMYPEKGLAILTEGGGIRSNVFREKGGVVMVAAVLDASTGGEREGGGIGLRQQGTACVI